MKRMLFLLLPLLLCLSGCVPSNDAYYEQAQLYLGSGDFETAAQLFSQLGEYEDAADYALYCAALDALENDQLALARANLTMLEDFKSSERYLRYITALEAEAAGKLDEALAMFEGLGSFEESLLHVQSLQEAIPERDIAHARALMGASRWEQALALLEKLHGHVDSARLIEQCRARISNDAYNQAMALFNDEKYEEALAAFESLGETLDSPARARMCRGAMYQQLEEAYAAASMANAADLIARYEEMEDYFASPQRLHDLQQRFAVNLKLLSAAYARPYVAFGDGLQWRVTGTEGSHVQLTAQTPVVFATVTDLSAPFTPPQEQAIVALEYPRLTIDLDQYTFTGGSGTAADPFR